MKETVKTRKYVSKNATAKSLTMFKLINEVVKLTQDSKELIPRKAKVYAQELQTRLGFETMEETVILTAFVNMFDDSRIRVRDIARHFDVKPIEILAEMESIDDLVKRQIILRNYERGDDLSYKIPQDVINGLRNGVLPEIKKYDNLSIDDFVTEIDLLLDKIDDGYVDQKDVESIINTLIDGNQHLYLAQKLRAYCFDLDTTILYLAIAMLFINNNDDEIRRHDIDDYLEGRALRMHCRELEMGNHELMRERLVEHACVDGQIDPYAWKLTDYSKEDILQELKLLKKTESRANMLHHEDIKTKKLYYNDRITKEVNKLSDLLEPERMERVLQRMDEKGMRKGFTCIFYGGPGTGKTETVLQLAKKTKRDIMLVDVPSIRSKWVGDTEKNIKRVFDNYRRAAKGSNHSPILVFNEADAILNKRLEGGTGAVDKMENAMQNIILQEMENLEGIMIATTNLTGNLDAAFERRFLYKIEFDKPSPKERKDIWKTFLTDLTDEQAAELSKRFDFSGGQIENIARKRIVSDILEDRDELDMDCIIESCQAELLNKKGANRIGF